MKKRKIILSIPLIIILLTSITLIHFNLTKLNPEDYLPKGYITYVKIPNLKNLYYQVKDLKALEIVFKNEGFESLYKPLLNY